MMYKLITYAIKTEEIKTETMLRVFDMFELKERSLSGIEKEWPNSHVEAIIEKIY